MTKNVDELLNAAKVSDDPTVKQALHKLLFVTSLAHDPDYIERAQRWHYHSGCTVTVPNVITLALVWNNDEIAVRADNYQYATFQYSKMLDGQSPLTGIVLAEDRNYQQP